MTHLSAALTAAKPYLHAAPATAVLDGDSRTANAGGRTVTSTSVSLAFGGGAGALAMLLPVLGNRWLLDEGFSRAVGATTTLAMLLRASVTTIASTGNPAQASTGNAPDAGYAIGGDGAHTSYNQARDAFLLCSVNDTAAYYNADFNVTMGIVEQYLDAHGAAGNRVFLANELPHGGYAVIQELQTVNSGACQAALGANYNFRDGESYGAPGVIGVDGSGVATYLTKIATGTPAAGQYRVSATGAYTFNSASPPAKAYLTYNGTPAGGLVSSSAFNKTMRNWFASRAPNFVDPNTGVNYRRPGALYRRPWIVPFDSFGAMVDPATINADGSGNCNAMPGTSDTLQLHQTAYGAARYALLAVKSAVDATYPSAPSRSQAPTRNNWTVARSIGTANPTWTGTLPPSMRFASGVPTNVRLAGVLTGSIDPATGAISGTGIGSGSLNFATGSWTVTMTGTPAANQLLVFEQDIPSTPGVGTNLLINGMMDMTAAVGSNLTTTTGTSSITGIAGSQVPYGYALGGTYGTAITNGTATLTVGSDTTAAGYPRFWMSGRGANAGTLTLQNVVASPTLRMTAGDLILGGTLVTYGPGSDGHLYGILGVKTTVSQQTTAVTRTGSSGVQTGVVALATAAGGGGTGIAWDDQMIGLFGSRSDFAGTGSRFDLEWLTPRLDTTGSSLGSTYWLATIAPNGTAPFSFFVGAAQAHLRVRNDA